MLSSKSVTAPVLNLRPSRLFTAYIVLAHALGLLALFYPMSISISVRILIGLIVVASFIYHWRTKEPVTAMMAPVKDEFWLLQLRNGQEVKARLVGEFTATTWMLIFRFKLVDTGKKITVTVLGDNGDLNEIRRMRVFLKQLTF